MMNSNDSRKELRVFVNNEQVSRWIFLEKLRLCFKLVANDGGWQNINYERGMEICKRIILQATNNSDIKVTGSLIDELRHETMISELFSKGRIVI